MKNFYEGANIVQLIVGFNLSDRRKRLGMGIEQMADGLGMSVETLLAFESGERRPDAKTLLALAKILNVAPHSLFAIPRGLDAASRAQLRGGGEQPHDPVAVMRAFARMKSLAGRDVVSDLAQAVSGLDAAR